MQQNKINILSTRPLPLNIIEKAALQNICIDNIAFLEIKMTEHHSLTKKILGLSNQELTVVFTSMNAVEAVAKNLNGLQPNWKIFCTSQATKNLVKLNFGENTIAGIADSADALANLIIQQKNVFSLSFFCGDKRRDELPDKLKQHGIQVNEVEVYTTSEISPVTTKSYDAILFYSPRAVSSFFSVNRTNHQTVLFAIGSSTADEIKKHSTNKTVISPEPSKKLMAEQAIQYFKTIQY